MAGERSLGAAIQDLFTRGIDAWAEIQVARYTPNDPTPQVQTPSGQGTAAGAPAPSPLADTIRATVSDPTNLVLLAAAAVLVVVLIKRS